MKRKLLSLAALAACAFAGGAQAQISDGIVKIGVLNDMSGLYSDITGPGSVTAAKMAVEDFGAAAKGMKVEIVGADHQNKPDIGSNVARSWIDVDKVDAIADVPTSSVALAMVLGGALGNLYDRVVLGHVVDFILVHWQNRWYFPAFNLADSAITVGAILLALDMFKSQKSAESAHD